MLTFYPSPLSATKPPHCTSSPFCSPGAIRPPLWPSTTPVGSHSNASMTPQRQSSNGRALCHRHLVLGAQHCLPCTCQSETGAARHPQWGGHVLLPAGLRAKHTRRTHVVHKRMFPPAKGSSLCCTSSLQDEGWLREAVLGSGCKAPVGAVEEQQLRDQHGCAAHAQCRTEVAPHTPAQQASRRTVL